MSATIAPTVATPNKKVLAFDVPDGWTVTPLFQLFHSVGGATPSKNNEDYWKGEIPWVSPKDMKCPIISDSVDHISQSALSESRLSLLPCGTVLIVVRGMILVHSIPVATNSEPVTINQDMKGLSAKKGILPEFLANLLRAISPLLFSTIEESGHGTRCLRLDLWRNILVGVPSERHQDRILSFIRRKTAQIDVLINKKQRLIELLQEKRQALISRAVTKGLNPNMPMKDSGIEWLGMIPQHWHAVRLKYVTYIQSGITLGKSYDGCDVVSRPYLRVANVQDGFLDLSEITYINLPTNDVGRYELRNGDVLMTEGGDFDKLGRGYVWRNEVVGCLHQNHVFAVRPDQRHLLPEFLASLMTSSHGKNHFTSTSQQTTNLATTNRTKLGDFVLPLPSVVEQIRIIKHVQRSSQHLQLIGRKLTDQITKLQEYRQTLISAAVTGKIDVRKEAHP